MIEKLFVSERGRMIKVIIEKESNLISFCLPQENNREFYSISMKEWISDKSERMDSSANWHNHMMEKRWFGRPMLNFLNENT